MTWAAALQWALIRSRATGLPYRVYGYIDMRRVRWVYAVGPACRCVQTRGAACPQHGFDDPDFYAVSPGSSTTDNGNE